MDQYKYLIIGGGVAGTTAASTIRDNNKEGSIAIISDEPHYLYSRIMLSKPNFFLGQIPFDQIWLKNEEWYKFNKVDFIGGKKAVALDSKEKTIKLDDGQVIAYDKLLIATGVRARELPVPGHDKKRVFILRTLDQGKDIIQAVKSIKTAVTVGGGFISFEMANLMRMAGAKVTMLIREKRLWEAILDPKASQIIEQAITGNGVEILKEAEITEIKGEGDNITSVTLTGGKELNCDAVICGIGAFSDTDWLNSSGIKIDRGVVASDYLQTNLPDIWAAGDSAVFSDPILEEDVQLGNWVNAQEQGRVAGLNMAGIRTQFNYVSFYTTHGFDLTVTIIGNARPKKEHSTVVREGPAPNQLVQIIISENQIVGAILLNQSTLMRPISLAIEQNVDISTKKDLLADTNFDLMTLTS